MQHKVVFCFHTNDHEYSMGIGFIAAYLQQSGTEVDLVIYREIKDKQIDTPEEIARQILAKKPSVVAFSVMTFNWHRVRRVIELLRPHFTGMIIVGGYHAILAPDEVISFPGVDAVCTGEGELPMKELLESISDEQGEGLPRIPGMIFKNGSADRSKARWLIDDLAAYPYMNYELFEKEGQARLAEKFMGSLSVAGIFSLPVITGRGCPFRCTYCSNSALIELYGGVKRFLRKYEPHEIVARIRTVVQQYRPQFIEFLDETFTLDREWVNKFCVAYKSEVGLPFSIMSRIDKVDDETIELLANSGLKVVFFGLECGDEEYRTHYLKRVMINKTITSGAQLLKKHGIMIVTFNIFGMPFETPETVRKTHLLNAEIDPDAAIPFIYQPFPGTKLGQLAFEHNLASSPSEGVWDYCTPALDTDELPAAQVLESVEEFRRQFCSPQKVQRFYGRLKEIVGHTTSS